MRYKFVLLPFPFDDLAATKVRPALCLTNAVGPHRHVVVAFVTSRLDGPHDVDTDMVFSDSDLGFVLTGLRVSSRLRVHRLLTVAQSVLLRSLGHLPPEREAELVKKPQKLFAIT